MHYDILWNEKDISGSAITAIAAFFLIIYWFLIHDPGLKQWFSRKFPGEKGDINFVLFSKYCGLLFLGICPTVLFLLITPSYPFEDLGLCIQAGTIQQSLIWLLILGSLIFTINRFTAGRKKSIDKYPQIRVNEWDRQLIFSYSFAWCMYLLGYEFLFRGLLLFVLAGTLGVWPAIMINISLYAVAHIPKGIVESIGAIILGFLLCIATLQTGNIWVAYFTHVILALTNSFFALKFNPEMKIVKSRKQE